MKKVASLLLLAGVAAFGLVGCGDDVEVTGPQPEITSVSVSPASVTLEEGQTASVTANVTTSGDVGQLSFSWSTADQNVATVSGNGSSATVTGQSSGTTAVQVTVSAANVSGSQTASTGVDVRELREASISIASWKATSSISSSLLGGDVSNPTEVGTGTTHSNARLVVTANVDEGDESVSEIRLLLNGEVVSTQTFGSASAQEIQAQANASSVDLALNTDRIDRDGLRTFPLSQIGNFATSLPDGLNLPPEQLNGEFQDGDYTVSVEIDTEQGNSYSAEVSEQIRFNNENVFFLSLPTGQNTAVDDDGLRWWGGADITLSFTPVVYNDLTVSQFTVDNGSTPIDFGAGAGMDVTLSSAPFEITAALADNVGNQDQSVELDVEDIRDEETVDVTSQFVNTSLTVDNIEGTDDPAFDFAPPSLGGAIQVLLSGGPAAINAGDYFSAVPASDFVVPGVTDTGVGGVYDMASEFFQIDIVDSGGNLLFEDVAVTGDLDENAPTASGGAVEHHARLTSAQDRLGNTADNSGPTVGNSADFGIDLTPPATSNEMPADFGSAGYVFNGDGTGGPGGTNELLFDIADPALANGETPSGLDNTLASAVFLDPDGNTLATLTCADGTFDCADETVTGQYNINPSVVADGPMTVEVSFGDNAREPNTDAVAFEYILDTTAPTFGALSPVPSSTSTGATSVILDIGGTVDDANVIASSTVTVRVDGTDAQGAGSDGSCTTGDYLLDPAAGEIDQNQVDISNGTNSIDFSESFEIEDPFPMGTGTVKYCFFVNATDEALDNTGAPDGNSASIQTNADVEWTN